MKIQDETKEINIDIKMSLAHTKVEVAGYELAAIIGSYMGQNDMTNEQFIYMFFPELKK